MVPLPLQRWQPYPEQPEAVEAIAQATGLSPLVATVLANRDITDPEDAKIFLNPELQPLPSALEEFPALADCVELLEQALGQNHKIAICGDYDADGMTSTALLLRALRYLGGDVDYDIPSRMNEGYGINERIVEDFHADGVRLILTVDNGITAVQPIARARELGLTVIITDHHELPDELPPANAILNPKLIPEDSGYAGMAGVGVAYILAESLARQMGRLDEFIDPLLELYTLGTIADMAALVGVNRRWLKQGLARLPRTRIPGIQALIQSSGVNTDSDTLRPEDIGFRLGPRINAIGRIGDPRVIIDLLTTDEIEVARQKAEEAELTNQERRQLCEEIEREAIAICEQSDLNPKYTRILLLLQKDWHHGVIGIVASRLVERYGMPVFISTYEGDDTIRGSARGIPEFNVFDALKACDVCLDKYGGHKAAGGFTLNIENFEAFQQKLQAFGCEVLEPEHLKPLVNLDGEAQLSELTMALYQQIDDLNPWGIGNPEPVFWSEDVRILEQRTVGKGHAKVTVGQSDGEGEIHKVAAIAWRWGDYMPLPDRVDIAYKLKENCWKDKVSLQLELVGIRIAERAIAERQSLKSQVLQARDRQSPFPVLRTATPSPLGQAASVPVLEAVSEPVQGQTPSLNKQTPNKQTLNKQTLNKQAPKQRAMFYVGDRHYTCILQPMDEGKELRIRNDRGNVLAVKQGQAVGLLGPNREQARTVDVREPHFRKLIESALEALETAHVS